MNVLLSVKPKYAEAILKGEKKYEFRKTLFKRKDVQKILIYSSSPVKRIVASFEAGEILDERPKKLWDECRHGAGIGKDEFFKYYQNKDRGYAIRIHNLRKFEEPVDPKELDSEFVAPQSFCYILSKVRNSTQVEVSSLTMFAESQPRGTDSAEYNSDGKHQ